MDVRAVGRRKGDKKGDGNNNSGSGTQKFEGTCDHCKKHGHMARDFRERGRRVPKRRTLVCFDMTVLCSVDLFSGECRCSVACSVAFTSSPPGCEGLWNLSWRMLMKEQKLMLSRSSKNPVLRLL